MKIENEPQVLQRDEDGLELPRCRRSNRRNHRAFGVLLRSVLHASRVLGLGFRVHPQVSQIPARWLSSQNDDSGR